MTKNELKNTISNLTTPRKITSYTTAFLLLIIIGVFQFVSLGCDFSKLIEANFYLTLGYRFLILFLAYYIANNLVYDKCLNSEQIKEAFFKFKELNKLKDSNFAEFLDGYNKKLKKEAWRNKVNLDILKIENKILRSISKKKSEKLYKKIAEKKKLLTDEYINENIDFLKVKHYQVLESDFIASEIIDSSNKYKTRTDYNRLVFKSVIKKLLPFLCISLVLGVSITNSLEKPALEVIINLISDLIIICLRLIQGFYDAQSIVDSAYLVPYSNKINILREYIEWNAGNPESKSSKILKYIEGQKEEKIEEQKEIQNG